MGHVIGCREAVQRLWTYLDDELDAPGRQSVEEHLAFCLRCCGELAFAREVRHVLSASSALELPPDVQHRLEGFVDDLDSEPDTEEGAPR